jgi:hypothetical protein
MDRTIADDLCVPLPIRRWSMTQPNFSGSATNVIQVSKPELSMPVSRITGTRSVKKSRFLHFRI